MRWNLTVSEFGTLFMEAFRSARNLRSGTGWLAVAAGGFAHAMGVLTLIALRAHFEFKETSEVIGWISVNHYPKQQEMFYFVLALTVTPFIVACFWALWLSVSGVMARLLEEPIESALRRTAYTFLPLLMVLRDAYHLKAMLPALVFWPACVFALNLALLLSRRRLPDILARLKDKVFAPQPPAFPPPTREGPPGGSADILSRTVRTLFMLSESAAAWGALLKGKVSSGPGEFAAYKLNIARLFTYIVVPALMYIVMLDFNLLDLNIDLFHEGEFLAPLNELLRGRTPFRDFYIQHGLFANVTFPYIAAKLFGATLEGWRLFLCLIWPVGYICIYFLGLRIFRSPVTAVLLMPIVHVTGLYRIERFSMGLISVALAAGQIGKEREWDERLFEIRRSWTQWTWLCMRLGWRMVLSGVFTVLAFFHSTEIGLYSLAAVTIYLMVSAVVRFGGAASRRPLRARLLPLACYCAGVISTLLPFLIYFACRGALNDMVNTIYIQCALQMDIWGLQFPSLISAMQAGDGSILRFLKSDVFRGYLPILWFLIGQLYLLCQAVLGRDTVSNRKFLLLWLWSVIFFRTALGRSDGPHILRGGMMMWLIWVFFLERAVYSVIYFWKNFDSKNGPARSLKCAGRVLFIAASLGYFLAVRDVWIVAPMDEQGIGRKVFYLTPDETERISKTGLFLSSEERDLILQTGTDAFLQDQKAHINDVAHYIRKNTLRDEVIFDFSNQGAYYFFADRPSATRYFQIVHAADGAMQREVIGDLEAKKPKIVIYQTSGVYDSIDYIPMSDRLPAIARYLENHYEPAENIRGTVLLRPKPAKGGARRG